MVATLRQLRTRGSHLRVLVLAATISATALASAAPTSSAVRGTAYEPAAAAPCSRATAVRIGRPLFWDYPFNLSPRNVDQVLCGSFTGAGSVAMIVSFRAPTCWPVQRWAVYRRVGGSWRLAMRRDGFIVPPLFLVDGDIQEVAPVYTRGDSRCNPNGGTQGRIWRWNGRRFTERGWTHLSPGRPGGGSANLFSPLPGRIYCAMADGDSGFYGIYCESATPPQNVTMDRDGKLTICTAGCALRDPAIWDERLPRLYFGREIPLTNFRCVSKTTGLECTLIRSGKGFRIGPAGITPVG